MRSKSLRYVRNLFFALVIFLSFLLRAASASASAPERIIIDTDPGTDDALAILLALNSPEVRVEALTIVAGNVTAAVGLDNALKVASLAGRCDLPIAKGAEGPIHGRLNVEPGTAPTASAALNSLLRAATPTRASVPT
jgi:hypothetical protein